MRLINKLIFLGSYWVESDLVRGGDVKGIVGGFGLMCYICNTMAKSNPVSVRFDLEKMDFLKEREKLKTGQQVLDFLLSKYWWENKIGLVPKTTQNGFGVEWKASAESAALSVDRDEIEAKIKENEAEMAKLGASRADSIRRGQLTSQTFTLRQKLKQ